MAQFGTVAELESVLRKDIPTADEPKATLMLQLASAAIQAETGQTLSQVAGDVLTLNGPGNGMILLPEIPVTAVTTVKEDGTTLVAGTDYEWDRAGLLRRRPAGTNWIDKFRGIEVTYSHGYATIPDDIKAVCLNVAARMWRNPAQAQEAAAAGGYSLTFARMMISEQERAILDHYRP